MVQKILTGIIFLGAVYILVDTLLFIIRTKDKK
jgi:hypothetical protein